MSDGNSARGRRLLDAHARILVASALRHDASNGDGIECENLRIPGGTGSFDRTENLAVLLRDVAAHLTGLGFDVSGVAEGVGEIADLPAAPVRILNDPVLLFRHLVEDVRLQCARAGIDFDAVTASSLDPARPAPAAP